jgi:hypothetical protein
MSKTQILCLAAKTAGTNGSGKWRLALGEG